MNVIVEPEVFRVRLGGPETTDEIVKRLGFPVNSWITQTNFPIKPRSAIEEVEMQIIDPGRSFNKEEGLIILAEFKLERPTHEHGIRFAEQCGKLTTSSEKPFILFLHEAWMDSERVRRILCLFRDPNHRWFHLDFLDDVFSNSCVLIGVKPREEYADLL